MHITCIEQHQFNALTHVHTQGEYVCVMNVATYQPCMQILLEYGFYVFLGT